MENYDQSYDGKAFHGQHRRTPSRPQQQQTQYQSQYESQYQSQYPSSPLPPPPQQQHYRHGDTATFVDKFEHMETGYGEERSKQAVADIKAEDNPNVYQHMNFRLFLSLLAMSFLWVGSQIPLYLFGAVIPSIYGDVGGAGGRYVWMVIGYLIPNAALCPFVGAMSDLFGRKWVAAFGQVCLMVGPIVVSTAQTINVAIGGMVISGLGAGLNELIALAGTSELVPVRKRGLYVAGVVMTILPFCPAAVYAQLIVVDGTWRWIGLLVGIWNFVGMILVILFYKDPARNIPVRPPMEVLREVDWIGGILSIGGVLGFMMGMQWGGAQYSWLSAHVLVPFFIGVAFIIAFFVWEIYFAKYPMAPPALFSKDKRTMVFILLITFFSGGNFFVVLLFWPTQVYNMYGPDPIPDGIRTLPIGFGIILGAALALFLFGVSRGRTTILMIVNTSIMTAFTGAMSVANTTNLNPTVYPILLFASVGVGSVIIPCSIIAQIVCPTELIGTITAITLSIRYIGGAIGFAAYYNVFFHKIHTYAIPAGIAVITEGITDGSNYTLIVDLVTMAAQSQYQALREEIATNPAIMHKDTAFETILHYTQLAFVKAYHWPYWISIAFGGVCVICAFGLKDIRHHFV